ncbi:MAG: S49 family peptidase [bacterium]|nr:S49 family peptidase [bacterium]
MFLLRLLFFIPIRLPVYIYCRLRNLARGGDLLFHLVPDRFTMLRPSGVLAYLAPRQDMHFAEYLALLRVFAESDTLSTLVYTVPDVEASWAEVEQLGRALARIDAAGKGLIAYCEGGNLKSLYLMSFARRRYAALHANFVLNYPATEGYFLKNTIARFGVTVETHHAGKFKAEGFEMFTRTGYSPAARKNLKELLGDFRARIDARFLESDGERKTDGSGDSAGERSGKQGRAAGNAPAGPGARLKQLAHRQILAESRELLKIGFFDQAVRAAVFEDWIRSHLVAGKPADPETDAAPASESAAAATNAKDEVIHEISDEVLHGFAPLPLKENTDGAEQAQRDGGKEKSEAAGETAESIADVRRMLKQEAQARRRTTGERALYKRYRRKQFPLLRLRSLPALATVTMDGPISMGRIDEPPKGYGIAALPYRELIKGLEEGREEAVFLYINSPGGGADASELLFDSIYRLSRVKPVFAVVGSVAASGGYYLACAANRIYASPFSILGSIGVIRIRPNVAGLYKKLGIKRESLFKDPTRDLFSEAGPLSPASKKLMSQSMQSIYDLFLQRVAQGRSRSVQSVSRYAEGRVFSGERFAAAQMIDGPLTLLEAVEEYRQGAGYGDRQQFQMNFYPEVRADLRSLVGFSGGASAALASGLAALTGRSSGKESRLLRDLEQVLPESTQARLLNYAPWQALLRDL